MNNTVSRRFPVLEPGSIILRKEAIDALCQHPWPGNFRELAIVYPGEAKDNSGVNPDNPAHFTCGVPHS